MTQAFLVGSRVCLREHHEGDLETWRGWFNDPQVTRFLEHGYFPTTLAHQRQRLQSMYESPANLQLAIVDKASGGLAGTVGLHGINYFHRTGDISVVVGAREHWGKGIGKEAVALLVRHGFGKLNLRKITAGMVSVNQSSNRLFLALGFHEEARLKEHLFVDGEYRDVIRMAAFQRDWKPPL